MRDYFRYGALRDEILALPESMRMSLRAALAAGLAIWTAQALGLQYPIYALISAIIVTDLLPSKTRELALRRFIGNAVGAVCGTFLSMALGGTAFSVAFAVFITIYISYILRLHDASRVAGYVCGVVVLGHAAEPANYAWWRFVETSIGLAFAMAIGIAFAFLRGE